jgi:hypothetical protein
LILNYEKISPSWARGAMNHALVYNTFFSFLEDIDIDEFNIFWDIVHMGMINVSPSRSIAFIEMKRLHLHIFA